MCVAEQLGAAQTQHVVAAALELVRHRLHGRPYFRRGERFFHPPHVRRRRAAHLQQRKHAHLGSYAQHLPQRGEMEIEVELDAVQKQKMGAERQLERIVREGESG